MKDPKIFSDSYSMTLKIFNYTKSIPKVFRPTLGRRLEEDALNLTHTIRKSLLISTKKSKNNDENSRLKNLKIASNVLDEIRINLKICLDLKIISIAFYKEIVEVTKELGRELGGLIKSNIQKIEKIS